MHVPRDLDALLKSELAAAVRLPDGTEVVRSRQRISLQRMRDQLRQELNDFLWRPLKESATGAAGPLHDRYTQPLPAIHDRYHMGPRVCRYRFRGG